MSGSWAAFARYGRPSLVRESEPRIRTLAPWLKGNNDSTNGDQAIRIIRGPRDKMVGMGQGRGPRLELYDARLASRCVFWTAGCVGGDIYVSCGYTQGRFGLGNNLEVLVNLAIAARLDSC